MKNILAVIIYDRYDNLVRWISNWSKCDKNGFELIIIHNDNGESEKFENLCNENKIKYIKRENVGFDIGAMQDVFLERLLGFPNDWDKILWCVDDLLIMKKNFINEFLIKHNKNTIPCMEISKEVATHIRTTGFLISKEVSKKIKFPANPITTKTQCYHFEHRGGKETFYQQALTLGVMPTMILSLWSSCFWDIGNKRHLRFNRWKEYENEFGKQITNMVETKKIQGDKVTVICPIFNSYPKIIGDMICQTHQNWELLLIHDGKSESDLIQKLVDATNDKRIKYWETKERVGTWGHKIRRDVLASLKDTDTDFVHITNPDNSLAPIFYEYMIKPMIVSNKYKASYCLSMVHSYKAWDVIPCRLKRGFVDCAGVVVRKNVACEIGFVEVEHHSADWFYFENIIKKYGTQSFAPVSGCILSHN